MVLLPSPDDLLYHYQMSLSHNHLCHIRLCIRPCLPCLCIRLDLMGHNHEDQLEELMGSGYLFYDELMEA